MADTVKFLVRLFDTTTKAADGSVIPRGVCEEYLQSDDYKEVMQNKIAWGGITHKDRKIDPKYDGIIGIDDQVLVSENASHYLTKMYFKDAPLPSEDCRREFYGQQPDTLSPQIHCQYGQGESAEKRKRRVRTELGQ